MSVLQVLIIVFLFFLFAASHTWLALSKLKLILVEKLGEKIAFYRLLYNTSSLLIFFTIYILSPKPDIIVYDLHYPYDIITFVFQVLSLVGFIWAAQPIDLKEFMGVSQIERYLKGEYKIEDLDEHQTFKIVGAFKLVRHPIYFFTILFLAFRPTMTLFYFVMFICILIYFYIGSIYEEQKLVEKFGEKYIEYQKRVPRFVPFTKRYSKQINDQVPNAK